MRDHGLYFAYSIGDACGLSGGLIYVPEEHDIQLMLMVGWLTLAIGYTF